MKCVARIVVLSLFIFGCLSTVWADTNTSSKINLDEIVVTPSKLKFDHKSTSGSRLDLPIVEIPASIHVIDNDAIINNGYLSVPEAVGNAPGVLWGYAPAEPLSFSMRGFSNNQVHILRDGIWLGPSNMSGRPSNAFNLDRIEILKGPASVLHGQGVVGGVIDMVSKEATPGEPMTAEALGSYGRYDTYQVAGGAGGPMTDKLWFRADISQYGTGGFVENADSRSLNATSSMLWKPTNKLDVKFQFDVLDDKLQNYWGTPLVSESFATRPLTEVVETSDGRTIDERTRSVNYNVGNDLADSEQIYTRLDLKYKFSDKLTLRNIAYYFDATRRWTNSENYSFNSTTNLIDRDRFFVGHDQNTAGDRIDLTYDHAIAGMPNRSLIGVDYRYFDFKRDSRFFGGVDSVDPFNPVAGSFAFPEQTFANPTIIETAAVFFEDTLKITPDLRLVGGFRYDHIDLERDSKNLDGSTNTSNAFERTFNPVSWRVGTVYEFIPSWMGYAQYSTGADPVDSNIFLVNGNQNFDLAESSQWEVGVKASLWNGRAQFTLAYYDIERENLLVQVAPGGVVENVGKQTSNGVEIETAVQLVSNWNFNMNAAYTHAKFEEFGSSSGNTPPNVADWTVNAATSYGNIMNLPLELGASTRYVSDRFSTNANTITLKSYVTADIYGAYTWNNARITVRVQNLLDEDYSPWADVFYPDQIFFGSPRAYSLSAYVKF